ncbi:TPA: hypothetical protein ACUNF5_005270 [Burkholderia orbicola]
MTKEPLKIVPKQTVSYERRVSRTKEPLKILGVVVGIVALVIIYGFLVHWSWGQAVAATNISERAIWTLAAGFLVFGPLVYGSIRAIQALR